MRESAVRNSPLPPSVEKAYHLKCIELKRRIRGVEESNDVARQRVHRLDRAIMKMRVNRAFLMDKLGKLQELNDSESEISSTRPTSPPEQPAGSRTRQREEPHQPDRQASVPSGRPATPDRFASPQSQPGLFTLSQTHTSDLNRPTSASQHGHQSQAMDASYPPSAPPFIYKPGHSPPDPPVIASLPNGTSVMLIAPNTPKPAPWRISELDPRHHVHPEFENLSLDDQEDRIFVREYLPFDKRGTPVRVEYDPHIRKYRHIFPHEPNWRNPIRDNYRRDELQYRQRLPRPPPGPEEYEMMMQQQGVSERPFGVAEARPAAPPSGFTAANR